MKTYRRTYKVGDVIPLGSVELVIESTRRGRVRFREQPAGTHARTLAKAALTPPPPDPNLRRSA